MKKISFILIILFSFHGLHAQEFGKTILGAKGGLNLANIGGEETDNALKIAAHIGGYAEFYFYDDWDFQAELLFSWQGHAPASDLENELKLLYLNVPITVRYFVVEKVNVHIGPQLGFLMSAKSKFEDTTSDAGEFFKFFELGAALGGGYDFELFDRDMNVTLRYIHGITNISEFDQKRFNRVIQISLGVMLADFTDI